MPPVRQTKIPAEFLTELENKFFWWDNVTLGQRTAERIIAQAMDYASFEDIRRLERTLGSGQLASVMRHAQPGWFTTRSWELWRGRLQAGGQAIPDAPPRRSI